MILFKTYKFNITYFICAICVFTILSCKQNKSPRNCDINSSGYLKGYILKTLFADNTPYCGFQRASSISTSSPTSGTTISPIIIAYPTTTNSYKQFALITSLKPTINKPITNCTSTPTLPLGLVLSTTDCTISGSPILLQANTSYTITASDASGTGTANISISVITRQPKFLLVANAGGTCTVSVLNINTSTGVLTQTVGPFATVQTVSRYVVVDPTGQFVYVANGFSTGTVTLFSINSTTGALTKVLDYTTPSTYVPSSLAIHPTGKYLYVSQASGTTGIFFSVNTTTGQLSNQTNFTTSNVGNNSVLTVDPTGKFLYLAHDLGGGTQGRISALTLDNLNGQPTLFNTYISGQNTNGIAIDQQNRYLYAINYQGPTDLYAYSINSSSGVLTATPGSPFSAGFSFNQGEGITEALGKYVYVSNGAANTITSASINQSNGDLTFINTIATGTSPGKVIADPSGKFVFVGNGTGSTVSGYTINQTTGALTTTGGAFSITGLGTGANSLAIVSY